MSFEVFCLSFKNSERKASMKQRLDTLPHQFYQGVSLDDTRIASLKDPNMKRVWSCMYGHLDMIYYFYHNTKLDYGVFCEDDIIIHKDLSQMMTNICKDFEDLKLDVLLLGYLLPFQVNEHIQGFELKDKNFVSSLGNERKYHNFTDHTWGTQMYMLSRKHAKYLLDKYYYLYAAQSQKDKTMIPFSADWTLTKEGNRAIISPMVCCEIANQQYENYGQDSFHKTCHQVHYDELNFI